MLPLLREHNRREGRKVGCGEPRARVKGEEGFDGEEDSGGKRMGYKWYVRRGVGVEFGLCGDFELLTLVEFAE